MRLDQKYEIEKKNFQGVATLTNTNLKFRLNTVVKSVSELSSDNLFDQVGFIQFPGKYLVEVVLSSIYLLNTTEFCKYTTQLYSV